MSDGSNGIGVAVEAVQAAEGKKNGSDPKLAAEIVWPEGWPAAHSRDLWGAGPDGTYRWRDQGDGFFSE